jgi:hypothetical protein
MEKDNKGEWMWYQHVKMESVENDKKKTTKNFTTSTYKYSYSKRQHILYTPWQSQSFRH